ncbi:hypothetical protein [Enterococcus sp. AZ192]|uniref:hypothetical protein n=1 Tax=unclassified Enterococcus TaxID=2608891 RepID=UPI003D289727
MKMKKSGAIILLLFSLTIVLSACGTNKLNGDYTGKINLFFTESTATLRFNGNKVTEVDDKGNETNEATYKISDNELEITHSDETTTLAELSEDKKSFTIKSSTSNGGSLLKNIKFIKEEK